MIAGLDSEAVPPELERRAAQVNEAVLPWLEQVGDQPFFLWVHVFDPHMPYEPPPPHDTAFAGDGLIEARLDGFQPVLQQNVQLGLGQNINVDLVLGDITISDEIVVMADSVQVSTVSNAARPRSRPRACPS